jgi:hypothetical protein
MLAVPAARAADPRPEPKELLTAALAAANAVVDVALKGEALRRVVFAQAKTGDIVGAEQTTKSLTDPSMVGMARGAIAEAHARGGDVKTALSLASAEPDARVKSSIYDRLIAFHVEKRDLAAAKALRPKITDAFLAAHADRRMAVAQAEAGDPAAARVAIVLMEGPPDVKVQAYVGVAKVLLKAKNQAGANEWIALAAKAAAQVPDYLRPMSLAEIAGAQALAGDVKTALAAADRLSDPAAKALVFSHVAEAQIEAGDIAGAKATAKPLTGFSLARLQVMMAEARFKAGDKAGAPQLLADSNAEGDNEE